MPEILTFTTEDEWKAARRQYVTSTEVSALFGQSPYHTAYELAVIKQDPSLDTFEGSERSEWGSALQEGIGKRVGCKYYVETQQLTSWQFAHLGFCSASGDFVIVGADRGRTADSFLNAYFWRLGKGMLEIKSVDSLVYKNQWTETDMPDHIEIQLQAEMLCWDTLWGAVAALVGGNRLALYVRERDSKVCELILVESAKFMHNLARGILPDPIMPQDAEMVIRLHQYAEPNKVLDARDREDILDAVRCYHMKMKLAAAAEKEAKSYKARIFELIGDSERVINCEGFNISASVRPPCHIEAYERAAFRGLNITERKQSGKNAKA